MWNGRLFCLSFSARRFPHPHHPFRIRWQRYKSEESRGGRIVCGATKDSSATGAQAKSTATYGQDVVTMVVVCFQVFLAFILLSGRVLLTLPIKFKEEPCAEGRTGPFGSLSSWVSIPSATFRARTYIYGINGAIWGIISTDFSGSFFASLT